MLAGVDGHEQRDRHVGDVLGRDRASQDGASRYVARDAWAHGMFDGCPDEAMVRASLDASAVPSLRTQLGARLFARAKR
jgi:hypothetical protein